MTLGHDRNLSPVTFMPRQERLHSATGIYHVMLRGINRQDIFEDDEDYLQMTSIKTKMITESSLGQIP